MPCFYISLDERPLIESTENICHLLTLSCRTQSIDLESKSMDWFLYNKEPRHERVKLTLVPQVSQSFRSARLKKVVIKY